MKNFYLCMAFMIVFTSCVTAGKGTVIEPEILEYATYTNYIDLKYGSDERHAVDISIPKSVNGKTNVILYIHGGSLIIGDKKREWMLGNGTFFDPYRDNYIIASMNYRFVGETVNVLDIVNDVYQAVNFIKTFTDEYGIKTNKIILIGYSAGAHLALLYSYKYGQTSKIPIGFCVSLAGPTDLTDAAFMYLYRKRLDQVLTLYKLYTGYDRELNRAGVYPFGHEGLFLEKVREISPITYVTENAPPTILVHDANDKVVPFSNSAALKTKLDLLNITNVFIQTWSGIGHTFGVDKAHNWRFPPYLWERLTLHMEEYIQRYCD